MNKENLSTKKFQSLFTMVVEFSAKTLYFGQHKKFTFRGDDLTPSLTQQVEYLKIKRQELLEQHQIFKCTIYDNRSGSTLPFAVVLQWYHNSLIHDNQKLLFAPLQKQTEISPGFLKRMLNENFLSHE